MGFLDAYYIKRDSDNPFNPRDPENIKKWEKIGLLEGLDVNDRWIVAFYFEVLLQYIMDQDEVIRSYEKSFTQSDFNTMEVHMFPIVRRIFATKKLNTSYFLRYREHASYLYEVNDFIDGGEMKVEDDMELLVRAVCEFIPAMVDDYMTWRELPKTLDTRIMLAQAQDPEAELVAWYAETFEIERVLDKIKSDGRARA